MNKNINYITQLTREDLSQMADAANIKGGEGIEISPTPDGLEVRIEKQLFTMWVKTIMRGGEI